MATVTTVRLPAAKLVEFERELQTAFPKGGLKIEKVERKEDLSARPGLGQVELVDVLVHAGTAVALHELVAYIKAKISYAKQAGEKKD